MGSLDQSASVFSSLDSIPYDEAYRVLAAFTKNPSPDKISLGAGVYRDGEGKPWTLTSVKQAIPRLPDNYDYLPQGGFPPFISASRKLLLGDLSERVDEKLISIQTVSGTGACHVGAVLLINSFKPKNVWISDPTWINHSLIWECAGPDVTRKFYPYYHAETRSFDFEGMIAALDGGAERGDVVILQACAHNPTGLDPSKEQWKSIADICEKKGLISFFDTAYQGFASGDVDEDAWAVRHFAERGTLELCIAQSFSKNFGLYGERVGAFHLLARDAAVKPAVQSQLVRIVRSEVSCSPSFGCKIVATVLNDEKLRSQWVEDLKTMSSRIRSMREALLKELQSRGTPGSWDHIVSQIGMFSYTGLNKEQVKELESQHHIYLLSSGRASIPGLTSHNVARVAQAIDAVVRKTQG
ncbi:Uu.00g079190.m01.CDS01 [Anthostomella pinea]|uniref:Aspartate aminotransferase n=1 Tax=Anthostomella pinea TaxID=933095 RepID=A0AAI8VKU5_9PEZI|nr:Uu.00g079190.m01.CDS01 [Anthostomella pinea]